MSDSNGLPLVLTIGHSNHSGADFAALLQGAGVTAVADVRSSPYSRRYPHLGRERLSAALRECGISYLYVGEELGGRPNDPGLFRDGVADYEKMAATDAFGRGLDRVLAEAGRHRLTLMCSEHDPLDCHRCLLVGRALVERSVPVGHILRDGAIVSHAEIEDRLLALLGHGAEDLFAPRTARLAAAYRHRAGKVAFARQAAAPRGGQHMPARADGAGAPTRRRR